MSMIEVTSDVKNTLLARREITCTFKGLAGKMKKPEAVDMVSKQFKLDGKVVVPIILKNETGRPMVTGTFYIYDDEKLAKAHLKPAIFSRLDKAKGSGEKEGKTAPAAEKPEEKKEVKESKEPKEAKEVKVPKDTKEPEKKVKEPKESKKEETNTDEKPKEKEKSK